MLQASRSHSTDDLPMMMLPDSCRTIYSHDEKDCSVLCSQISASLPAVIGFDMEWLPSRKKGHENKTAVIQICTATQPNKQCFVFHIYKMGGLPLMLRRLIENENIMKTGIGVSADLWKLHRDFNINWRLTQASYVDLNELAKSLSYFPDIGHNWSLKGLTKHFCHKMLSKSQSLQLSNWEIFPLDQDQIHYAALDVYVSLYLYEILSAKKFASSNS